MTGTSFVHMDECGGWGKAHRARVEQLGGAAPARGAGPLLLFLHELDLVLRDLAVQPCHGRGTPRHMIGAHVRMAQAYDWCARAHGRLMVRA